MDSHAQFEKMMVALLMLWFVAVFVCAGPEDSQVSSPTATTMAVETVAAR